MARILVADDDPAIRGLLRDWAFNRMSDRLAESRAREEALERYVRIIRDKSAQLARLAEDFLLYSRLESTPWVSPWPACSGRHRPGGRNDRGCRPDRGGILSAVRHSLRAVNRTAYEEGSPAVQWHPDGPEDANLSMNP